jgi:hypothetical protein
MSNFAKKGIAWLWMAVLLVSTIGISVHSIYCYCVGESNVSIFFAEDDACLSKVQEEMTCCTKDAVPTCCEADKSHSDCTDENVTVYQLKTEFLVDQPFVKTFDCPAWVEDLPFFKRFTRTVLCCDTPSLLPDANAPPSPTGRDICIRHELFLC